MNNLTDHITVNVTKKAIKYMHRYSKKFTRFWYNQIINDSMLRTKVSNARKCNDKNVYSYIGLTKPYNNKLSYYHIKKEECISIVIYRLENNLYLIISNKLDQYSTASILYLNNSKLTEYIKLQSNIFNLNKSSKIAFIHTISCFGSDEYKII